MSAYRFPDGLSRLRDWLAHQGADDFKTERQAAFFAQRLAGTRFRFPLQGESCFPLLKLIQESLRDMPSAAPSAWQAPATAQTAVPAGFLIYADGACEPNPGPGGWGFVAYRDGVEVHHDCGGAPEATNQKMELTAALMALRWLAAGGTVEAVRLLSDSQYVVKGCNEWRHSWKRKGWRRKGPTAKAENASIANLELWQALDDALTLRPIVLEWVRGHAGFVGNERADALAVQGLRGAVQNGESHG